MKVETRHEASCDEGDVRVSLRFDRSDVQLRATPFGTLVAVDGFSTAGEIGGPGLPSMTIRIAVPYGMWPTHVEAARERTVRLSDKPLFVAPVQPLRPAAAGDGPKKKKPVRDARGSSNRERVRPTEDAREVKPSTIRAEGPFVEPFPAPPVVPPSVELYEREVREPRPIARAIGIKQVGVTNVLEVAVNPVRFDERGRLELVTEVELAIAYRPDAPLADRRDRADDDAHTRLVPEPRRKVISKAQAIRATDLARELVVNPALVHDISQFLPELRLPVDYLVITDNQLWDERTIEPTGAVSGDMVAAFERLAAWKRSRGVRARVVTVEDIVGGRYGHFRSGARDLQEVIRKFLKAVHGRWGVTWLLVGGDVGVIPPRRVAGDVLGMIEQGTDNPPKDNKSFWTGSFMKLNVVSPGTWWPGTSTSLQLIRPDTGVPIPYDAAGTASLGWYFTTSDTYATRSATATQFVRVNGTAGQIRATLQWLYEWNTIPTDLYYASLESYVVESLRISLGGGLLGSPSVEVPYVWFPEHDWDGLDNGIYGQHDGGRDLDGVVFHADLSVGRAPVQSETEATAFVDKVIAYERYRRPDGSRLDSDWPRRMLLASSNWGGAVEIGSTASSPPGDDSYHRDGATTRIRLKDVPADFLSELIAEISDSDRRVLPFKGEDSSSTRGWYFARGATDDRVSVFEMSIASIGLSVRFPLPSNWIVVHGSSAELAPVRYLLDRLEQDGSLHDQEQLRQQVAAELPKIDEVTRLYKDELDLTPAQAAAAPVQHLTPARMAAALGASPHFVSLSGHGNSDGCCGGSVALASSLTNGFTGFIGYADSCLTNQFDANDAFGEALVTNPNGGAVAYVGSSRFSWIGMGDDMQRAFFHRLRTTRHLGLLHDSRLDVPAPYSNWWPNQRWALFSLNLMGDPEMKVWVGKQKSWLVEIAKQIDVHRPLVVKVLEEEPHPPRPVPEALVHVVGGDVELLAHTDEQGEARFDLSSLPRGDVHVTVSGEEAVPVLETVRLVGPEWLTGTIEQISHEERPGGTLVEIAPDAPRGRRRCWAATGARDYGVLLDALTDAYITRTPISLLLDPGESGGRIVRFRFGGSEDG